jgi:hypothetical protein
MSTDPKPTLYEILEAWSRNWEEQLKEPADLLLDRSFGNLVGPTLIELRSSFVKSKVIERSANGWARALLELVEARFREGDLDIYFYKLEYPQELQLIEQLLTQGKFDVSRIYPLLEKIQDGPTEETILTALKDEVKADPDIDFDRFITGSALLLRRAFTRHSPSSLKERLSVSIARHGTTLAVRSLVERISGDEGLFSRISESWTLFVNELLSFDIDAVKSAPGGGITKIFDLYSWDFKARELIEKIRLAIFNLLHREKTVMAVDEAGVRQRAEAELSRVLKREYSLAYLQQLFEMPIGGARFESENLQEIGQELATILLNNSFEDKQFRYSESHRPNPVDACCYDAFANTIKSEAHVKFSSHLRDTTAIDLDPVLIHNLLQQLWESVTFKEINWTQSTDSELHRACEHWLSSLDVHKQLAAILTPLDSSLRDTFRELLIDPRFSAVEEWIAASSFWEQWLQKFSQMAPWDRGIFHYVPWDQFDEPAIDELFYRLIADFQPVPNQWSVVFTVHKLDPPSSPKMITGITFYDPKKWDYGEGVLSSNDLSEHVTAAKIDVTARSFLEAKRVAATQVREVLNCMALSLSVSRMRGGYKPTIDPEIFARRLGSFGWSSDRPLIRNERPIAQSFLNFERFGPMFDFLIQASRSQSATMLQQKLLKALHWYAKARWDDDPAQSLLFYWIALEHLFEEGNDDRLLNLVAALHINWRDVLEHGWYFLGRHESDVVKQLNADSELPRALNLHTTLKDWNKDRRVLLNHGNVRILLDLISDEKKSLKDYVEGYREYLYGFVQSKDLIIRDMEALRATYRFRLLVIKQIRNEIVHQALGYASNVGLYTDELEKIFEEAIVKLTNDAIQQVPQCNSIKELIAQYEEMWIS